MGLRAHLRPERPGIGLAGWLYFLAALAMGGYVLVHAARLARDATPLQARRLLVATYIYVPVVFTAMALGKGI